MELTQAEKTKLIGLFGRYVEAFEKSAEAAVKIADATAKTMETASQKLNEIDD